MPDRGKPNRERMDAWSADPRIRERVTELAAGDEHDGVGSVADATFFKQHPGCRLARRLATQREVEALAVLGERTDLPGDWFWWVLVEQI